MRALLMVMDEQEMQYPFFTEGTTELLQARVDIARYSLPRAKARVETAKLRLHDPDHVANHAGNQFVLERSEIGDDRPLTGCSFSLDASMLATSSWSGITKVWSTTMPQNITQIATLRGHTERATDVAFSPVHNSFLATASADKTAKLWNISDEGSLITTSFDGHQDRLARLAFHPSGNYLGTASFDRTWRLWDVNTGTQLLLQEGHSRGVYAVTFHPDGSLAASCGLDAHARVWDLRSGTLYCTLTGHMKPVLGASFSPDGHLVATAGEDNFCRIWDLRTTGRMLYSIPAHKGLVSQVKFGPREGGYLATSSYDTTAALWSARDYKPIKRLAGHESMVTCLDIMSGDGQRIVTVSHDRTIKMWSCRSSSTRENQIGLD